MTDTPVTDTPVANVTVDVPVATVTTPVGNVTVSATVTTVPSAMVNGTLAGIDSLITTAKNTLDAEILAAQVKAKSSVSAYVTTAEAALADIKTWIAATPGDIKITETDINAILNAIETVGNTVEADAEWVLGKAENAAKDVVAETKKTGGFLSWWKNL